MADLINGGLPFRSDQLADLGLTSKSLRAMLHEHEVRHVFRRVYVATGVPDSRELRATALHLVMPPHGVLYGCTSAWLLGVDTLPPADWLNFVPTCVIPHGKTRCTIRGVRSVEGYIPTSDTTEVEGLRLTVPVRTTVDLLRTLRRPYAKSAADAMARAGYVTADDVRDYLKHLKGFPGIIQARELVGLIEPQHESAGESWQDLRLVDAGYPRAEPQYRVYDHKGRLIARLDHAYPLQRVGIEYDGAEFHDHEDDQEEDDRQRTYLRDVLRWRIIVNRQDDVLGKADAFERQVGEYLGLSPQLPRLW
ncbi:MAG TPA: hypothetical protein VEX15_03860 [Nocardioidaceae bacterium]|nr:hypothetical protein [Nocardioidaceae bacterium]